MRSSQVFKWTGHAGVGLLLLATSVMAEPNPSGGGASEGEVEFLKGSQLTAHAQSSQADVYIGRMRDSVTRVKMIAETARKEKDIIKLNCVNDKLLQITGHLGVAMRTRGALVGVHRSSDSGSRNHEFAKLTITYQKVVVLAQEAEACIGEEISYVGSTRIDTEMDPNIPQEDPTVEPPAPLPVDQPPIVPEEQPASPTT